MYWRLANKEVKYLTIYFFLIFVRDFTSNVFAYYRESNLFIYNIFSIVEIIFLYSLFYKIWGVTSETYKKQVLFGGVIALLIGISLFKTDEFSSWSFTVTRIYGISNVMGFYYQLLVKLNIKNIIYYSLFWISAGLLLYQSGTFFIFLLGDVVLSTKSKPEIFRQYWDTNLIFYIVFCLLASVGIWFSKYDKENFIQ